MTFHARARNRRRGNTMVWLAVSLTAIIGVVALGLDGGRLMEERRRAQAAADAAALAGAKEGYDERRQNPTRPPSPTLVVQAATDALARCGYVSDGVTITVSVQIGPTSGSFKGNPSYLEVIVESRVKATFGRIFTSTDPTVRARAVSRFKRNNMGLVALQPNGPDGLVIKGNATLKVVREPIQVNSDSNHACHVTGNASIEAQQLNVVGNLAGGMLGKLGGLLGGGTVTTGADTEPDPLASLPVPVITGMPVCSTSCVWCSSSTTLQPGIYHGGLVINGGTTTLDPGIYIIDGGGVQVAGQGALAGSGVLIYNTGGNQAGSLSIQGQGSVNLSAPTSGPYNGVCIFQDRAGTQAVQLGGKGNLSINGIIYARAAAVNVTGNGAVDGTILGSIICNNFAAKGGGSIVLNPNPDPPSTYQIRLVE
jgi:hypothetical protein